MRFESIEIKNYRQYQDEGFDFTKTKDADVHLIIASNGVGKTNILNAINWCIYGDEPHTSGTAGGEAAEEDKLPLANLESLKEAEENGENECTVSVHIDAIDGTTKYQFERSATVSVQSKTQIGKDRFVVKEIPRKGGTRILPDEEAFEAISIHMPKKIREYFFFDGEQLLNYFNNNKEHISHLRDSILEIAQVNLIDITERHLKEFIGDYKKEIKKSAPDLEPLTDEIAALETELEAENISKQQLDDQIQEAEEKIKKADSLIKGTETVLEDDKRYEQNKTYIADYQDQKDKLQKQLAITAREFSVKLLMYDVNKRTNEYIEERKGENSIAPVDIKILKKSLKKHKCQVCGGELNEEAEEYFESLIEKYNNNMFLQKLTGIESDVKRGLDIGGYEKEMDELYSSIEECEDRLNTLEEENAILLERLSKVGDKEGIKEAVDNREKYIALRDGNLQKKGACEQQIKNLEKELKEKRTEYQKALKKAEDIDLIKRKHDLVERAHEIVSSVKKGIVDEVKEKLQEQTIDLFNQLLWKENTYGRIELDDDFHLKLFHKETDQSCLESCSAAEKELLALAFTLAIHDVSGYDNLLFIDTPVGRVSDKNRQRFARTLLDVGERKQIIIALTPSEYSDEIKAVLNEGSVSSKVELGSDEKTTRKGDA